MQRSNDSKVFEHIYLNKGRLRKGDILELGKLGITEADIRNYKYNCTSVKFVKEKSSDKDDK